MANALKKIGAKDNTAEEILNQKSDSTQNLPHSLDKAETAAYISDVVLQLRNMAKSADLKFLVYFLEMSFQEAFSQSIGEGKDWGQELGGSQVLGHYTIDLTL